MALITRIVNKPINQNLLAQELSAAGLAGLGASYVGFIHETQEKLIPKPARSAHATSTVGGVTTEFLSDPGELHFRSDVDPGVPLDVVLTAHDWTQRSLGQAAQDAEDSDKGLLEIELAKPGPTLSPEGVKASARLALRV